MLQDFARQQYAGTNFNVSRLEDEFNEGVVFECRARRVTPLVQQPGTLAITTRGIYFQVLHNLAGGSGVKFHPAEARTMMFRQ